VASTYGLKNSTILKRTEEGKTLRGALQEAATSWIGWHVSLFHMFFMF